MPLVAITWPKVTFNDALVAASAAWRRVFGRFPTWDELVLAVAWAAHETARFKNAANYNPGGLTVSDPKKYKGSYFESDTHEYKTLPDGTKEQVKARRAFRAYRTLEAGFVDLLAVLRDGYPQAVEGMKKGEVGAFVAGLYEGWGKSLDWATAPFALYLKAVAAHVPEAERALEGLDDVWNEADRLYQGESFGEELMERVLTIAEAALWRTRSGWQDGIGTARPGAAGRAESTAMCT